MLSYLGIKRLNIFCIDGVTGINKTIVREPNELILLELSVGEFIEFLNNPDENFRDYNKNSLYILRDSSYKDVKLLFQKINNCSTDLGRGNTQKSHILSPLDFRLSSYLIAMFNFKYEDIYKLNTFSILHKNRYLPIFSKKIKEEE